MRSIITAVLAILTLFGAMGASAQSEYFKDRGPYMSFLLTGSFSNGLGDDALGLGLAPAVGYRWLPLRVELEYLGHVSSDLVGGSSVRISALTLNAIVESQLTEQLGVFLGAGYGRANVKTDSAGSANAQQLQLGITLGSPNSFQMLIGYRQFTTGSLGFPFENNRVNISMTYLGVRFNL